ncbi:MAG: hypothetical protein LBP91_03055 [Coriobacteriales bacterium]|nr:hypothetical protein [Coriobacteriales bacterium]
MMINGSLVVLFVVIVSAFLMWLGFTETPLSAFVASAEQINYAPLAFGSVIIGLLLCLIIVALILYAQNHSKRKLIGQGRFDLDVSVYTERGEGMFDYSQIDTPEELNGTYTGQSDLLVEKVIRRLEQQEAAAEQEKRAAYVPRHSRVQNAELQLTAPIPCIRLVHEIKDTRKIREMATTADVPEALNELLRKIS